MDGCDKMIKRVNPDDILDINEKLKQENDISPSEADFLFNTYKLVCMYLADKYVSVMPTAQALSRVYDTMARKMHEGHYGNFVSAIPLKKLCDADFLNQSIRRTWDFLDEDDSVFRITTLEDIAVQGEDMIYEKMNGFEIYTFLRAGTYARLPGEKLRPLVYFQKNYVNLPSLFKGDEISGVRSTEWACKIAALQKLEIPLAITERAKAPSRTATELSVPESRLGLAAAVKEFNTEWPSRMGRKEIEAMAEIIRMEVGIMHEMRAITEDDSWTDIIR